MYHEIALYTDEYIGREELGNFLWSKIASHPILGLGYGVWQIDIDDHLVRFSINETYLPTIRDEEDDFGQWQRIVNKLGADPMSIVVIEYSRGGAALLAAEFTSVFAQQWNCVVEIDEFDNPNYIYLSPQEFAERIAA